MAREPKSPTSDIMSQLENLSVADLDKVIAAAEHQREAKRESGKRELMDEFRARAEELGVSLEDLVSRSTEPARSSRGRRGGQKGKTSDTPAAKYRNAETGETWSGRGRMPRWLKEAEEAGRDRDEFRA